MSEVRHLFFDITPNSTIEELTDYGEHFVYLQKGALWWIGDLARYAKARFGDDYVQCFPTEVSPGLVDRCKGVAKAYPNESDRNPLCTWTQHMQVAKQPNRLALLAEMVAKGQTSDESRNDLSGSSKPRWLLAVDVNYHLHRHWYSGSGVEAAKQVSDWIGRTVERLKEKGLTDCVACFDGPNNFRKQLTEEWEDKYKPRPPKEPELIQQLQLVRQLIHASGIRCVTVDGLEADDLMASYAAQFDGRVTIMSQDKDLKQCLGDRVNMLLDIHWEEDPTSGDMLPDYQWLSAKQHTEQTGLRPDQWVEYQAIWGDNVDGIKGAPGIGEKGAKDLLTEFGTLDAVIEAARANDERIKAKKREAILELAERLDVVRQLVTLKTDVRIPLDTRV